MYKDFPAHGNSLQSLYCRKEFYITPMNGSLWERKKKGNLYQGKIMIFII